VTSIRAEVDVDTGRDALDDLARMVERGRVLVLSGAGLSTESGIPDYRGPTGQTRSAGPMTIAEFRATPQARQRYWARSFLGWQAIAAAEPNDGHRVVAQLEQADLLAAVITQNVDGLHQRAGARNVIELHGTLDRVVCLECRGTSSRWDLEARLHAANADWRGQYLGADTGATKPDGDYDLDDDSVADFVVVDCATCSGTLKPDVVFFGENVQPDKVAHCYELVEASDLVLVLGSSLTVASGFRFVRRATKVNVPVAIINQGTTRGDPYAQRKLDAPLGTTLAKLARRLGLCPALESGRHV
jgi:NAD-dependent SIR2 family protein deacetylase